MTFEKAKELLEVEYEKAKQLGWVIDPVAYAVYQVWKKADEDRKIIPRKK